MIYGADDGIRGQTSFVLETSDDAGKDGAGWEPEENLEGGGTGLDTEAVRDYILHMMSNLCPFGA